MNDKNTFAERLGELRQSAGWERARPRRRRHRHAHFQSGEGQIAPQPSWC